MGYLTRYTHTARYYTLREIPRFDELGPWRYGNVGFCRAGTLPCGRDKFSQALVLQQARGQRHAQRLRRIACGEARTVHARPGDQTDAGRIHQAGALKQRHVVRVLQDQARIAAPKRQAQQRAHQRPQQPRLQSIAGGHMARPATALTRAGTRARRAASELYTAHLMVKPCTSAGRSRRNSRHKWNRSGKDGLMAQENLKKAELALGQTGAGESLIRSAPQAMVEGIARLKAQVTAQEIRLSTMRGYLTDDSPQFQLAQRELGSLRSHLTQAGRDQPAKGAPATDYLNRFRDFKYQETLFELMAKQYEMARLDEAREGAVIQVIDPAVPPEWKSKPKRALIAVLTALAAGFALLLFVFVRESLRKGEANPEASGKLAHIGSGFGRLYAGK